MCRLYRERVWSLEGALSVLQLPRRGTSFQCVFAQLRTLILSSERLSRQRRQTRKNWDTGRWWPQLDEKWLNIVFQFVVVYVVVALLFLFLFFLFFFFSFFFASSSSTISSSSCFFVFSRDEKPRRPNYSSQYSANYNIYRVKSSTFPWFRHVDPLLWSSASPDYRECTVMES